MSGQFDTSHLRPHFFREIDDDATTAAIEKAVSEGKPIEQVETIYVERCRLRYAGDPKTETVFNAHDPFQYHRAPNQRHAEWYTAAQFFSEQYDLFTRGLEQVQDGIPLEECSSFISAGRMQELKDLDIHTAEALAGLEGSRLARLGPHARALVLKAKSFIKSSKEAGETAKLSAQLEDLKRQIAELKGEPAPAREATKPAAPQAEEEGDTPPAHLKGAARTAWIKKKAAADLAKRQAKPDVKPAKAKADGEEGKPSGAANVRKMLEAYEPDDLRNMLAEYGRTPKPGATKEDLVDLMVEVNEKAERGLKATEEA